jgi:hypothetical protein
VNHFWLKIKHGNTAKVAAAYAAVSWVLLQAQEAILPTIGAPVWVAQTILFLMLVGFPIACVIAWASDANSNIELPGIQPEGALSTVITLSKVPGKKSL